MDPPPRSNRFVNRDGDWFYKTRENRSIGPYPDRVVAEKSAKSFAEFAQKLQGDNLENLIKTHLDALVPHEEEYLSSQSLRAGEWEAPKFRSERIYQKAKQWYFHTREGRSVGPYVSHHDVEYSAKLFTDFARTIKPRFIAALIATMNESL